MLIETLLNSLVVVALAAAPAPWSLSAAPALAQPRAPGQEAATPDQNQEEIAKLLEKARRTDDLDKKLELLDEALSKSNYGNAFAIQERERVLKEIDERNKRLSVVEGEKEEREGRLARKRQLVEGASQAYAGGDYAGAVAGYKKALEIDPGDEAVVKRLEFAQVELSNQNLYWWIKLALAILSLAAAVGLFFLWWTRRSAALVVTQGPDQGRKLRLEAKETVLGALAMEVDYAFSDSNRRISRRHCTIARIGGGYALIDHSTNGTFVNGEEAPRDEVVPLRRGDQISLAGEVFLRFR